MARTPKGNEIRPDEWTTREHELVFEALDRGVENVEFPIGKGGIVNGAGNERVLEEPEVKLRPYLETLPDRAYRDRDDVAGELNQSWVKASREVG